MLPNVRKMADLLKAFLDETLLGPKAEETERIIEGKYIWFYLGSLYWNN